MPDLDGSSDGAHFKRARRYYLRKRIYELRHGSRSGQDGIWRAKQEAEPGVALPATFPFLSSHLAPCGYETVEDLDGASVDELRELGLTRLEAEAVLAALAPLI